MREFKTLKNTNDGTRCFSDVSVITVVCCILSKHQTCSVLMRVTYMHVSVYHFKLGMH